jgi:hypothetical protein
MLLSWQLLGMLTGWEVPLCCLPCNLQTLAAGRSLIPGFVRLSSLALLGQNKMSPAVAQLCAWLRQGSQNTREACDTVVAVLSAMHSSPLNEHQDRPSPSAAVQGAVQQLADAAVERCRSDPGVAVAVALQLLSLEVCVCVLWSVIAQQT